MATKVEIEQKRIDEEREAKLYAASNPGILGGFSNYLPDFFGKVDDTKDALSGEVREFRERDVVTEMKERQLDKGLPTFKLGINSLPEYNKDGTIDYALGGLSSNQETDISLNIEKEGLNPTGLAKLEGGATEFSLNDFKPAYIADKGSLVLRDDGTYENSFTGGILPKGIVFNKNGLLSSVAGRAATQGGAGFTGSGAINPSPGVANLLSNLQNPTAPVADAAVEGLGGMEGLLSSTDLISKVIMMRGLLDNSSKAPQAAAPQGAAGLRLATDDLYKRFRG
tara:strand:+ start:1490 stop:2335 length:846 start_codon:yes stop_codon:yes gene_type:complete